MRILTGKDRIAFESIIQRLAASDAENQMFERICTAHRENETRLLTAFDRERQRAANAIDELLAMRGIAPVSVPPEPRDTGDGDIFAEDPGEVAKIEKRMMDEGYGSVLLGKETE